MEGMVSTIGRAIVAWVSAGLLLCAFPAVAAVPDGRQPAVQATSVEAFALRIVSRLNDRSTAWGVPNTPAWYDSVWLNLVRDNDALARALQVDSLYDAAAICQCHSESGHYQLISTSSRRDGMAEARLRFSPSEGSPISYTVVLARIGGSWRIYDVVSNGHSTRTFLTSHVACLRAARTHRAAERCSAP